MAAEVEVKMVFMLSIGLGSQNGGEAAAGGSMGLPQ